REFNQKKLMKKTNIICFFFIYSPNIKIYCGDGEQADTYDGQVRHGEEDGEQNEVEGALDINSTARACYPATSQDADSRTIYCVINKILKTNVGIHGSIMGVSPPCV
ncbi:MAG: hypothetical protein JSW00_09670, partial [Thermoplasmata archaeon]